MFISNGVEMLEISISVMGKESLIYPTVIWDDKTVTLVDAGFPGKENFLKIREEMDKSNISFKSIDSVILTHQDLDHIGGVPNILKESQGKIKVLSHNLEKPYIQGEKRLIKITDEVIAQLEFLPSKLKNALKLVFQNPPKAKVGKVLVDGEELHLGDGAVVIHTPGHTPGHICIYVKKSRTLIAGDALNVRDDQLFGPDLKQTIDVDLAFKSLEKLMQYDIETVICYHGGVYRGNVNQRIINLTKDYYK